MDSSLSLSQTVAVAGLVALCGACVFARKGGKKERMESPLVPGWPILGNALDMDSDAFIPKMDEHAARYGTTFHLDVLGQKYIHLGDAMLMKEVLGKRPKLLKRVVLSQYSFLVYLAPEFPRVSESPLSRFPRCSRCLPV
jgi:hypothetical protein